MASLPLSLFAGGTPAPAANVHLERVALDDDCWVDVGRSWLDGADALLDQLLADLPWRQERRLMWNNWVDEPRLTCGVALSSGPPVIRAMARALRSTYGIAFDSCWCNHYRDGNDSVAWHADRIGRVEKDPLVAIVSLGGPRTLALRPRTGGVSRRFRLWSGDLLVMGGATQHRWHHAVPKCADAAPRTSVTFRRMGEP